jgi:hypothetical protein
MPLSQLHTISVSPIITDECDDALPTTGIILLRLHTILHPPASKPIIHTTSK